jgi:hypothetical protein
MFGAGNVGGARQPARAEYQQTEIEESEREPANPASHAPSGERPEHGYTRHGGTEREQPGCERSQREFNAGLGRQFPSQISRALFHEFVR